MSSAFRNVPDTVVEHLRAAMRQAPATAQVTVQPVKAGARIHYAPFLAGERLSRIFNTRSAALDHAATLQGRLAELRGQRERPCMCCRQIFVSAGIHNRLCDTCRHLS